MPDEEHLGGYPKINYNSIDATIIAMSYLENYYHLTPDQFDIDPDVMDSVHVIITIMLFYCKVYYILYA